MASARRQEQEHASRDAAGAGAGKSRRARFGRLAAALTRRMSPLAPALLRQADWRFLLPNPEGQSWNHVVLLGGSPELARLLVENGIAKRSTVEVPREPCADAVIVLQREIRSLERAAAGLLPGGSLYAEIGGFRFPAGPRSPGRVVRSLTRLGMSQIRMYRLWPSLEQREAYLPLDASGPTSWYVGNVFAARTLRRRLAGARLRFGARLGERIGRPLVCRYAVTAVSGEHGPLPSLLGHPELPSSTCGPGDRLVMLTGGDARDVQRRVVLLPFHEASEEPGLVIKLWRSPDRNRDSADEQSTLRELGSTGIGREPGLVPAPLGLLQWGKISAGVESYCAGRSFAISALSWGRSRRRKIEDLDKALAGLAQFCARGFIRQERWGASAVRERLECVLKAYEAELLTTPAERLLFDAVRERAEALQDALLPLVWSHPDLGPSNVLIRPDAIVLIDWARAAESAPLLDVLYFALISCFEISHARDEGARVGVFRRLFVESDPADRMAATARRGFERCLLAVGADPEFFPVLLVLLWVSRCVGRLERSRAVARGEKGVNPKVGNPYVSYVRALAKGADSLFPGFGTAAGVSAAPPTGLSPSRRNESVR